MDCPEVVYFPTQAGVGWEWGSAGRGATGAGDMLGHGEACRAPRSAEAARPGGSVWHWAPQGHARAAARRRSWGENPRQTHSSPSGRRPWCQERPSGSATISGDLSPLPEPSCLQLPARSGSPARHHAAARPGLQSCREPKPWWGGKPGAAAASPPRCAPGPCPGRLPCCSNMPSPSLPPRAPRIGKESQRQLPRHRRVSGSPAPGHACSGVRGQRCACRGVP